MKNSKKLFDKQRKVPNWLLVVWLVAGVIGFVDATYLSVKHYIGEAPGCSFWDGCEAVLASSYSQIGPVPVALLGMIYYLLMVGSVIAYLDFKKPDIIMMAARFTVIGLLVTSWFVYLQAFVIKAWCAYCLLSALISVILFVVGMVVLDAARRAKQRV